MCRREQVKVGNIPSERRSDDVHTPELRSDEVLTDLPRELGASSGRHGVVRVA